MAGNSLAAVRTTSSGGEKQHSAWRRVRGDLSASARSYSLPPPGDNAAAAHAFSMVRSKYRRLFHCLQSMYSAALFLASSTTTGGGAPWSSRVGAVSSSPSSHSCSSAISPILFAWRHSPRRPREDQCQNGTDGRVAVLGDDC